MSRRFCLLLCVVLLQGSCGSPSSNEDPSPKPATSQAETQVAELESKITKWQSNRDKLKKLLEQLQQDKRGIVQKLVQLGVKSENDLANNPKGQVLHGELKDIVKQATLCEKKFQDYDLAILKTESRVRSVARQLAAREAGVSDTELEELTRSMVTLDESLSSEKEPAVPIDLKDTLKDELAHYQEHGAAEDKADREKAAADAKAAQENSEKFAAEAKAAQEQAEKEKTAADAKAALAAQEEAKKAVAGAKAAQQKAEQDKAAAEAKAAEEKARREKADRRKFGPTGPGFRIVWNGPNGRFIDIHVEQTRTTAKLVLKAHNFADVNNANKHLNEVRNHVIEDWQKNGSPYKGKTIKGTKHGEHKAGDVWIRTIEFQIDE